MDPNGTARTSAEQAGFQAATMASTFGVAIVGGLITGKLCSITPPNLHYYIYEWGTYYGGF